MSILWNPAEATVVEKVSLPVITTGTQNMGDGIYWLKAGTPLDEDYAVANDDDAIYIVAEDFFFVSTNPNQDRHVPLVKAGYVDINKAEASAGITFADAAKSALETAGIVLVDGLLEAGGGSDLPDVGGSDKNKYLHTNNSTGNLEWASVKELPDYNYSPDGYVLQLDEGSPIWSSVPSPVVQEYAGEEGGGYVLGTVADSLYTYCQDHLVVVGMVDENGVNRYFPILEASYYYDGDSTYEYHFRGMMNGSIIDFTSSSEFNPPVYTPT